MFLTVVNCVRCWEAKKSNTNDASSSRTTFCSNFRIVIFLGDFDRRTGQGTWRLGHARLEGSPCSFGAIVNWNLASFVTIPLAAESRRTSRMHKTPPSDEECKASLPHVTKRQERSNPGKARVPSEKSDTRNACTEIRVVPLPHMTKRPKIHKTRPCDQTRVALLRHVKKRHKIHETRLQNETRPYGT